MLFFFFLIFVFFSCLLFLVIRNPNYQKLPKITKRKKCQTQKTKTKIEKEKQPCAHGCCRPFCIGAPAARWSLLSCRGGVLEAAANVRSSRAASIAPGAFSCAVEYSAIGAWPSQDDRNEYCKRIHGLRARMSFIFQSND